MTPLETPRPDQLPLTKQVWLLDLEIEVLRAALKRQDKRLLNVLRSKERKQDHVSIHLRRRIA